MKKLDDTDTYQNNDFIYKDKIKNNLYNLFLLINSKLSNKEEINIARSTIDDLILILKFNSIIIIDY